MERSRRIAIAAMLHKMAQGIRDQAVIGLNSAGEFAGREAYLPSRLFGGQIPKQFEVGASFARRTEAAELVRVYLDYPDIVPEVGLVATLLRMEIEPFIIGVGQVRTEQTPEGFVILRADER